MNLDCVGEETSKDVVRSLRYDGAICPVVSFAAGDLSVSMECIYLIFSLKCLS
jgi:hypothetical protein